MNLLDLSRELASESKHDFIVQDNGFESVGLTLMVNGKPVGYSSLYTMRGSLWIVSHSSWVGVSHRRKGYGKILMQFKMDLLEHAKDVLLHCVGILAIVHPDNAAEQALLRKFDWAQDKTGWVWTRLADWS